MAKTAAKHSKRLSSAAVSRTRCRASFGAVFLSVCSAPPFVAVYLDFRSPMGTKGDQSRLKEGERARSECQKWLCTVSGFWKSRFNHQSEGCARAGVCDSCACLFGAGLSRRLLSTLLLRRVFVGLVSALADPQQRAKHVFSGEVFAIWRPFRADEAQSRFFLAACRCAANDQQRGDTFARENSRESEQTSKTSSM